MSSPNDDTILPARRPVNSSGLDGDTVLPSQNVTGIHVPGDVIDNRYTVIREIGHGGMGIVYEVLDSLTGDHYAVKKLLPEFAQRPEIVALFRTEGAASMRFTIKSSRFVTTQMLDMEGDVPFIVLQLIAFPTLRRLMTESVGKINIETALPIIQQIAVALDELHCLGYVHRDLKPENVFVDIEQSPPAVMLVDFGLTKDVGETTKTVMRGAGTERYASPEQKKGLPTNAASDVYAFGVIAYEMLTGQLPEIGDCITDFVDDVPDAVDAFIIQCLSSRPERRPSDGTELVRLISRLMESTLLSAVQGDTEPSMVEQTHEPVIELFGLATLELTGVPVNATVFLDGVQVAGLIHEVRLAGEEQQINIRICCDGYADYSNTTLLNASQVTIIAVEMIAKEPATRREDIGRVSKSVRSYPHLEAYVDSLCSIPGGRFEMGGNEYRDEQPVHPVQLSPFRLGANPITVGMWREYCAATGTAMPGAPKWGWLDDHPIVNVCWNNIMGADGNVGFCAWASDIAGFRLTLPTEAQFEYASRSGQYGLEYPWGTTYDDTKVWSSVKTSRSCTAPVVRTSNIYRNEYGLTDMSGNVWEWCLDYYAEYPCTKDRTPGLAGLLGHTEKKAIFQLDPQGPASGSYRCVRGGSWSDLYPDIFRCAYRYRYNPDIRFIIIGFRLSAGPG